MNTRRKLALLTVTAAFLMGGCAGMSRQEVSTVTVTGAAGGAVVGGVIGHEAAKK